MEHWDKIRYCWAIYHMHIRDSSDEDELAEYVERVTDIVEQEDLNEAPVCAYTQSVFKILAFFKKNNEWSFLLYWLDKLDPELLDDRKSHSGDMVYPSKKEEYYNLKSKALLECAEFEECIEVSRQALETFDEFSLNGDVWHKFRIAKSLRQLGESAEALTYLEDVLKVYDYWYVYREFAENYFLLNDYDSALKFAWKGVLAEGSVNFKVNLYYLIYKILKDSNPDLALNHAKLYLAIKLENGTEIPEDIEDLGIDDVNLDKYALEQEIKSHWLELEFKY
jgi:tetratricopeptide (TPR) repeat protein